MLNFDEPVRVHLHTTRDTHSCMRSLTVNVNPLWRRVVNVLLGEARYQVLADDGVEGPSFVRPGHLLPHGGQEALWVEETGHPENLVGD